jgi:hypothetical protein
MALEAPTKWAGRSALPPPYVVRLNGEGGAERAMRMILVRDRRPDSAMTPAPRNWLMVPS